MMDRAPGREAPAPLALAVPVPVKPVRIQP